MFDEVCNNILCYNDSRDCEYGSTCIKIGFFTHSLNLSHYVIIFYLGQSDSERWGYIIGSAVCGSVGGALVVIIVAVVLVVKLRKKTPEEDENDVEMSKDDEETEKM